MAMPENIFSDPPVPAAFLPPDDRVRLDPLIDYELGGIALGDPSQGLQVQVWECRVAAGMIQVRIEGVGLWTNVIGDTDITEVSLAFDQNMRPTVSYMAGGVCKLYWYDADIAAFTTSVFAGGSSPVVMMDDKRAMEIGLNDILLFYVLGGRVIHRLQRDRFLIAYDLAPVPAGSTRIQRAGMSVANRIQVEFDTSL